MKLHLSTVFLSAALLGATSSLCAQNFDAQSRDLQKLNAASKNNAYKTYVSGLQKLAAEAGKSTDDRFRKEASAAIDSALQVADDLAKSGKNDARPFTYYTVDAMSNLKRLAHTYPTDGQLESPVSFVAAKGEFEAASFVLYPFADAKKVELKVSDLKGKNGMLPASAVDLKVVKIWWQAGVAWYSYFADTEGRELIPELLLNDENLLKVDVKGQENYLRMKIDGKDDYVWISSPAALDIPVKPATQDFADASVLQPFELKTGEFKQIWLTLEAPKNAEGTYTGSISVKVDGRDAGEIPLVVRILPFELPTAMTNYDLSKEYYVSIYNALKLFDYVKRDGGDLEKSKARLLNEYVSLRKHNFLNPMLATLRNPGTDEDAIYKAQLEIYKKAGLDTKVIFDGMQGFPPHSYLFSEAVRNNPIDKQPAPPEEWIKQVQTAKKYMQEVFGKTVTIYAFGWDEPGRDLLHAERKPWKYLHEDGIKVYSTTSDSHLRYGGYNEDFVTIGGHYNRDSIAKWHAFGARATSYANPHTGPENPDFVRRTHGLDLYASNADGTNNYILNDGWNEFIGVEYNYRGFNIVYSTPVGFVDTVQYEGFREAIDDVRYATLLKQLANKAIATGKVDNVYQGKMALQWFALLDTENCDLNQARLEMINYILKLMECK